MLGRRNHVAKVESRAQIDMNILDRKLERGQAWPGHGVLVPELSTNLVELLRGRADERPQSLACSFLSDGGRESERLSYAELDREARRIAAWLQATRAQGDRISCSFLPGWISSKRFSVACTPG